MVDLLLPPKSTFYMYKARPWVIDKGDPLSSFVEDGDTVHVTLSSYKGYAHDTLRLFGVDTPENHNRKDTERETSAGDLVAQWLFDTLIKYSDFFVVQTEINKRREEVRGGKFGRTLGHLFAATKPRMTPIDIRINGMYVNGEMIDRGFAKPYLGKKKEPWTENELSTIVEALS